jgi:hypothetical protein
VTTDELDRDDVMAQWHIERKQVMGYLRSAADRCLRGDPHQPYDPVRAAALRALADQITALPPDVP